MLHALGTLMQVLLEAIAWSRSMEHIGLPAVSTYGIRSKEQTIWSTNLATVNCSISLGNENMSCLIQRPEQWARSFSPSWFWQLNYNSDTNWGMKSDVMREASVSCIVVFVEDTRWSGTDVQPHNITHDVYVSNWLH
jgi:hypothetical protein